MILELAIQVHHAAARHSSASMQKSTAERPRGIFVGPAGQRAAEISARLIPPPFPCLFIERSHGPLGAQLHAALHLDHTTNRAFGPVTEVAASQRRPTPSSQPVKIVWLSGPNTTLVTAFG